MKQRTWIAAIGTVGAMMMATSGFAQMKEFTGASI
jgi:hypothetical protein